MELRRLAARFPALVLARRNLSRATARSTLAVVAVVIGVVAIGAIGTGGEAFKQDQAQAYEGFGGTATVERVIYPDEDTATAFSAQDLDRMRQVTEGATVRPVVEPTSALVETPAGETIATAQVTGINDVDSFYEARSGTLPDTWRRRVVVGSRIADSNDIEPGDQITVLVDGEFARTFHVAAVLQPQGFADPLNADQSVFVPLAQFDDATYETVIVRIPPETGSIDDASAAIESEFNARRRTVYVNQVQEQRQQFERLFETINQFLVGVGTLSLLVAAVTIANTMLMSALEREGEIGVMRAVGIPKVAVIRVLVAEAGILGLVGAAVGVPIALGLGLVINQLLVGNPLAFTVTGLQYIAVGAIFGIATALLAGLYPAWKAANKRPVEAFQ